MAEFPLDIVFDVLSRLPVKSVLRFRCVCKPWCSLISEPQFVKTQLNRAISDVNVGCQRVLIPNHNGLKSIDYETQAQQNNGGNASTVLDFPWSGPDHCAEFVGSCHGMVCVVVDREKIVLCNPCTREFRELPEPTSISIKSCINGGLGYDSYVDDYKFVIAVDKYEDGDDDYYYGELKAEVFSLRSNSWRILQDIPPNIFFRIEGFDMGVFSNGALHWIASCETGQQIISFDLATEKFKKMSPLPPCDQRTYHNYKHLILLRGCLSVSREFPKETTEVWVMKEYGVKASWTKLFTFTLREPGTRLCGYGQYLRPVCFSKNGELLVDVDGVEIRIYNQKEDKSRKLFNGFWWFKEIIVYLESLVSPNGNAERNQPS